MENKTIIFQNSRGGERKRKNPGYCIKKNSNWDYLVVYETKINL
ncbi:hypothetical protein [Oceanobacillus alkalisoli]|nr:hypothetical protein [Oceanobacillus alkalisoli]